ncbi:MAG: amino acid adenylation domain-containing protein [Bacteroidales bacterium]|nr:amino acid adenylation domain-containing protein [Bacteroidales bacterium]
MEELLRKLYELEITIDVNGEDLDIFDPNQALTDDLLTSIKSNKSELLELFKNTSEHSQYYSIPSVDINTHYKLSSAQKRLLYLYELDKTSCVYNMPDIVKFEGSLDKERLNNAFKKLISRHECLRTSFEVINDEAVQKISDYVEFEIETFFSDKNGVEIIIKNFIRPFNLKKAPLLRVGLIEVNQQECFLMFDMHHIITDGVSFGILINDFMAFYNGKELPELRIQYKDYSEWQQSEEQQKKISREKKFWINEFSEESGIIEIPTDFPRPEIKSYKGRSVKFKINTEETSQLQIIADTNGVTLFILLLSIYNILLSKLSNKEDIVIGTPTAGRQHTDLENMIGMFVNTLPLRNYPKGELSFKEFLIEVKNKTLSCFDNQEYQYDDLISSLNVSRDRGHNLLFNTMFVFQNIEKKALEIPELKLTSHSSGHTVSRFDQTLAVVESQGQLFLTFDYSTELYKKETIERFITYFKKIVSDIITDQSKKISEIEIVTESEKQQLLIDFNNTDAVYPKDKTIYELFEEQVDKSPDNVALILQEKEMTYKELNEKSNQIARLIVKQGVKEDDIVGIMVDRSFEMIIGIIGILKSGGAYLPIDPNYPEERIKYIITNSRAKLILTKSDYLSKIKEIKTIDIEDEGNYTEDTFNLKKLNTSNSLAYLIYTSGSTGNPKGVMVEHHSLVNHIYNQIDEFKINEDERILQFSTYTFDASVEQIFLALMSGSSLVIISNESILNGDMLNQYIKEKRITHIHTVPALLENISTDHKSIKRVISGGDKCPVSLARRWYNICDFYNKYGPTETTITSIEYKVKDLDKNQSSIHIGKPTSNTKIYILNSESLELQPIGVPGEICIGGFGLARGYWDNEELTNEKFIVNPFNKNERIYRTGDLAKWLPDGNIKYLNRIDNQVKIRGNRIELGEIEHNLSNHEKIKEVIVTAIGNENEKSLCAYIISEAELDTSELRAYLSQSLPEFMIPSYFVRLEELPLTANGKINRKALPDPEINIGNDFVAASDQTEEKLVEIWAEVLKIDKEKISVNKGFFELGGNSLKAFGLVSKVHKAFNVRITIVQFFKFYTIIEVANYIKTMEIKEDKNIYNDVDREEVEI